LTNRLKNLRNLFDGLKLDAFLVTFLPHLHYLSGFSGSNGIGLVTRRGAFLVSDSRYTEQIKSEVKGWKVFISTGSLIEEISRQKLIKPGMRIGVDGNTIVLSTYLQLKKTFPGARFLPKVEVVDNICAVKDESEIALLRKAASISDAVFDELLGIIKPGMEELEVAAEISYRHKLHGAVGDSFEPMVVSGARGALVHGSASNKKLKKGEMLTLDFGCVYQGYNSDMTRTIALGKPSGEMQKIYAAVLLAQHRAIEAARSGLGGKELDAIARDIIAKAGYKDYFQHSLGHGIGLQVHELPRISIRSKQTLASGNVVTIEPGIYVPDVGGVRIEDMVLIRDGRCETLTHSPKHLIVL
jgi:Xaa-Pro aminopeptidase